MLRTRLRVLTPLAVVLAVLLPTRPACPALPMPGDPPPGNGSVDQMSGSAQLSVPVEVPPGAGGFSPTLAMTYSSQGGDSPYGVGFALSLGPVTLGEVRVSTRFLPNGASITYELDGERLLLDGSQYHTAAAESFKRITREGSGSTAGWLVELPDGTKARYGQDASSRYPASAPTRWLLSAITDKSGNTIRVAYADLNAGTPSVISYSYQGYATNAPAIGGLREIRFVYETRPDPLYDFMGYELRAIIQRVREIRVLTAGSVFRRYSVLYTSNGAGQGRSFVSSIQAFGTDCTDLTRTPEAAGCFGMPAQSMAYTKSSDAIGDAAGSQYGSDDTSGLPVSPFIPSPPPAFLLPPLPQGVEFGDVNGDGLPDLVQAGRLGSGNFQNVYLNTGEGWSPDPNNSWTTSLRSILFSGKTFTYRFVRPDDPRPCFVTLVDAAPDKVFFLDQATVSTSNPDGTSTARIPQAWKLQDLDGDGYSDLIASYLVGFGRQSNAAACSRPWNGSALASDVELLPGTQVQEIWLNNRQGGWTRSPLSDVPGTYPPFRSVGPILAPTEFFSGPPVRQYDFSPVFADFDGDTLPDVAVLKPTPSATALTTSETIIKRNPWSGFAQRDLDVPKLPDGTKVPHSVLTLNAYGTQFQAFSNGAMFVDVNRDGIADFLKTPVGAGETCASGPNLTTAGVWLGKRGGGFCSSMEGCPGAIRFLPPVDLQSNPMCMATVVFNAQGNPTPTSQMVITSEDTGVRFSDIDGDGWTDLVQGKRIVAEYSDREEITGLVRRAFLFDPSGAGSVWREDQRFAPNFDLTELGSGKTQPTGVQLLDVNADGADDVVLIGAKRISRSTLPGLIASLDNGRGGVIGFAHETQVRRRTTSDFTEIVTLALSVAAFEGVLPGELGLPSAPAYSTPRWTKRPVVAAQTARNMAEVGTPDATMEFTYAGPGYSLENRSSLGFAGLLTKRPDGSFLQMIFAQQKGVAGRMVSMSVRDTDLRLLSETRNVFAVLDGSSVRGSAANVPVARLVASKSRLHYLNDPLPAGQYTQVTTLNYDDSYGYNFISSTKEQRNTGVLTRKSTPLPAGSYITPTVYIPGLPSSIEQRDSADRLLSRDDFEYDTAGRIMRMTAKIQARDNPVNPTNRVQEMGYDSYGNLRSMSTGAVAGTPLVTQFICYDGDTALEMGTCPDPSNSLNSHSLVVGMRDPLGKVMKLVPNPISGLPERVVAPNGDSAEMVFDAFGRMTEGAIDPVRGGVARTVLERRNYNDYYFPNFFRPFVETFKRTGNGTEEIRSAMLPDGFGRVDRVTEATPSGYVGKVITRDPVARTTRETFQQACTDGFCRDIPASGFPASTTTVDALGRTVQVEEWGDAQTRNSVTLAQFDRVSRSQPTAFTPPNASMYFDGMLAKNANGGLIRRIFDGQRLVWSEECTNTLTPGAASLSNVSCATPDTSYFVYDATGEQIRLFDPLAYPNGPFNDPNRYVGLSFDTLGRRISSSDPDAGTVKTVYNVLDQMVQLTNGRNQSTTFSYDALARVKTINRPGTDPDATLTYGDELDPQRGRGIARVVNASAGMGPTQEDFQYDPFDHLSSQKATFTIAGVTTSLVAGFQSDLLGRPIRIDYPDSTTSVGYTYQGGFLSRVCELSGSTCTVDYLSSVEYDSLGREFKAFGPSYVSAPNLTPYQQTNYDPKTYLVAHQELKTVQSLQGNTDARLNFDYQYDFLGNVTSIDDLNPTSVAGLAPFSDASYTYDSRNRLSSRTLGGVTKYYAYDKLGNLTGNLLSTSTAAANQIYDDPDRPHAIKLAGATTFAYDADGNMTGRGSQYLGYNSENRLICAGASSANCMTVQIAYDFAGLRSAEVTSTGVTLFVGDLFEYERTPRIGTARIFALGREIAYKKIPVATLRSDDPFSGTPFEELPRLLFVVLSTCAGCALVVVLYRSGAPRAWARRPVYASCMFSLAVLVACPPATWASAFPPPPTGAYRRWISSDKVGSALYIYDEQGRRADKRIFEPFGGVFQEASDSEVTPRRFGTHSFDSSLNLYYMKARFYDPNVGRFTSIDPVIRKASILESVNPYSYVENNPVNKMDVRGTDPSDQFDRGRLPQGKDKDIPLDGAGLATVRRVPNSSVLGVDELVPAEKPAPSRSEDIASSAEKSDGSSTAGLLDRVQDVLEVLRGIELVPDGTGGLMVKPQTITDDEVADIAQAQTTGILVGGLVVVGTITGGLLLNPGSATVLAGAGLPKLLTLQQGGLDPAKIGALQRAMIAGQYRFAAAEGRIAVLVDRFGRIAVSEGNNRVQAAVQILRSTGNSGPIRALLENAKVDRVDSLANYKAIPLLDQVVP